MHTVCHNRGDLFLSDEICSGPRFFFSVHFYYTEITGDYSSNKPKEFFSGKISKKIGEKFRAPINWNLQSVLMGRQGTKGPRTPQPSVRSPIAATRQTIEAHTSFVSPPLSNPQFPEGPIFFSFHFGTLGGGKGGVSPFWPTGSMVGWSDHSVHISGRWTRGRRGGYSILHSMLSGGGRWGNQEWVECCSPPPWGGNE